MAFWNIRGAFAEAVQTPQQTEGPFYPNHLPLDTDNDLLLINDETTPALGEVAYVSGKILGPSGAPIRNAVVEIWQCDNNGNYIHSEGASNDRRDKAFQGFGRFVTGSTGEYLFRTIKPVAYPGRTPHIHFAVKLKGHKRWTTQLYVKGNASNQRDGIYMSVRDPKQRESITADFAPLPDAKAGELAANFDIVMGFTPEA